MTRASIIIPVYNGSRYLSACLEAVEAEISGEDDVWVVDNASQDNSLGLIQDDFPWVHVVRNSTNLGFAAACNLGADRSGGTFLVFLNQDTVVCPGWLSGLLQAFDECEMIGMATSKLMLLSSPDLINACGVDLHYSGLPFQRGTWQPVTDFDRPEKVNSVAGASFAIFRELWNRLDGFDENFYMYYEETDLSWRARRIGYESWYVPISRVYHDDPLQASENTLYFSERNRWMILWKHWHPVTFLLLLPGLILAEVLAWFYLASKGRTAIRAKLRSVVYFITHVRSIYIASRSYQKSYPFSDTLLLKSCLSRIAPRRRKASWFEQKMMFLLNIFFQLDFWFALKILKMFIRSKSNS